MENILFQKGKKYGSELISDKYSNAIICKSENIYGDEVIVYKGICKPLCDLWNKKIMESAKMKYKEDGL